MATAMVVVAMALVTETKTAVAATEGTMAGSNDQNGSNRVEGSEDNDGNTGAICRHQGGMSHDAGLSWWLAVGDGWGLSDTVYM